MIDFKEKANLIWKVADLLRGDYKQSDQEYFKLDVLLHVPDAWIDESKTKTGYEINFTKYFYEFKKLRSLSDIKADILALEEETIELDNMVLE